jgi:hypothetical protein
MSINRELAELLGMTPQKIVGKKPTIAELEAILDSKGQSSITINPDGSIESHFDIPDFVSDARLVLREMAKREDYVEFLTYLDKWWMPDGLISLVDLILDTTGKLRDLAIEFLNMGEKGQAMTEELELYKELQPLFKERMGEWQAGDRYATPKGEILLCTLAPLGFVADEEGHLYKENTCIRLPLPIDPVNPERGLLGMLEGDYYDLHYNVYASKWVVRPDLVDGNTFEANTPTLALLKALKAQEGV